MEPKSVPDLESNKLEDLYYEYFETANDIDEDLLLIQPSPLRHVDSFTTYGTETDLPIDLRCLIGMMF